MLHPVGPLPAAVYWRRRVLVLAVVLSVVSGGAWLGVSLLRAPAARGPVTAAATSPRTSPLPPLLDQVVPSLAGVQTPTSIAAVATTAAAPTTSAPVSGGPCSDAMLSLQVHAPASAALGAKPTFELVISNISTVACLRPLDASLQEMVLLDAAGNRVWGSADCATAGPAGTRTLAPAEVVSFPVTWSGLTSEPTCTAPRVTPPAGSYVLRGRLDTLTGPDVPFSLSQL